MTPQSVFLRLVLFASILLLVSLVAMFQGCGDDVARNCTLTVNGCIAGEHERIEFEVFGESERSPDPLYLVIANLGPKPVTYAHHSTGPMVHWEFDVNGATHACETYGIGSGVYESRTLQSKQAGVIPVRFPYARLSDALKKIVLPPDPRDLELVDAKVRAVLSIHMRSGDGKPQYVKLTSEWSKFQVGFIHYPISLHPAGGGVPR